MINREDLLRFTALDCARVHAASDRKVSSARWIMKIYDDVILPAPLFFSFSPVYTVIWREIRIMFGLIYKRIWVKGSQKRFAALFKKGCARWSGESKENELFFKDYSTVSLSLYTSRARAKYV